MFIIAFVSFVGQFLAKYIFGIIGENVTMYIRTDLYKDMVRKNMGWFDEKDNAPGVLSTILASDAQVINGVSTEGLAIILQAGFSVVTGIVIGFIYCWQMSLVCLACVPFMMLGGAMNVKR